MAGVVGPAASPTAYFAMLPQNRKEDVLADVAKEVAARFRQYRDAIKESTALRDLKASDRLKMYTARQAEVWARLQDLFPKEYRDQMKDWYHLQRKIAMAPHPVAAESTSLFGMRATANLPSGFSPNGGLGA